MFSCWKGIGVQVAIASDHAGYELKQILISKLTDIQWKDLGPHSDENVDYPDYAKSLVAEMKASNISLGILVCGTGIGMSIAANRSPDVRASAVCCEEAARLTREHNDSNILCLGSRLLKEKEAITIAKIWLNTPFSGEERHKRRIQKLGEL